jgi:hypothetical protein
MTGGMFGRVLKRPGVTIEESFELCGRDVRVVLGYVGVRVLLVEPVDV